MLAGGNFWDGARQGFITAALNHVAHGGVNAIRKTRLARQLTKAGYNIDAAAAMSHEYIKEMIQKVLLLRKQYERAGSPDIDSWILGGNTSLHDGTEALGYVQYDYLSNTIKSVSFFDLAFTSNFQLASTLGHELVHLQDIYNGSSQKWFNKKLNSLGNKRLTSIATAGIYAGWKSELNAYRWEMRHGNSIVAKNNYDYYFKLLNP
ncbi:hypothetical protein [Avrilella dinanensis]|uniref:hypothetical protein n=1 Tax=Avrilella dinanensis TaxID=2008672 RepID=UPI0024097477|nr:hypothetical protein [Avrilella dinanensis]